MLLFIRQQTNFQRQLKKLAFFKGGEMAVTKNPIFLQSCMYVYSWFLSKSQDVDDAKTYSALEIAESDKKILEMINTDVKDKNKYSNVNARYNKLKEVFNESN
jgi:hypothetical protein